MKHTLFASLVIFSILCAAELQTFKLQNGTKIIGTILGEEENVFEVETALGLVQIEKKNIKKSQWKIFMNDGTILVGNKISSSKNEMVLNTDIGVFKIKKDDYFLAIPKINNIVYFGLMFIVAILK